MSKIIVKGKDVQGVNTPGQESVTGEFNKIVDGWKDELRAQKYTPKVIESMVGERLAGWDEECRHGDPRMALMLIIIAAHRHNMLSPFFVDDDEEVETFPEIEYTEEELKKQEQWLRDQELDSK